MSRIEDAEEIRKLKIEIFILKKQVKLLDKVARIASRHVLHPGNDDYWAKLKKAILIWENS